MGLGSKSWAMKGRALVDGLPDRNARRKLRAREASCSVCSAGYVWERFERKCSPEAAFWPKDHGQTTGLAGLHQERASTCCH